MADSSILILRHLRPDGDVDTYHLRSGRRYVVGRGSGAQVRVLDPKMSRHHAAFEVRDGAWKVGDLGSTNGVKVDGDLIAGWTPSPLGSTVEVGASVFAVHAIVDPDALAPEVVVDAPEAGAQDPRPGSEAIRSGERPTEVVVAQVEQEPAPASLPSDRIHSGVFPEVHDPQPATDRHRTSGALEPVVPARPVAAEVRAAVVTPPPAPAPAVDLDRTVASGDATYFVTVLGQRIGPVTRAVARELKARELRGALTDADLDQYPKA